MLTAVATGVSGNKWVLDSGASYHMTPNRDFFSSFEVKEGNAIAMGNGAICKSMGSGSVQIRMFDEVVRMLTNVRYVPGLRKSLISLGQLDSLGCKITIEKDCLRVSKGELVVMKGSRTYGIYLLQGVTVGGETCVDVDSSRDLDATRLWHLRLGHVSERSLDILRKREMIDGESFNN